MKGQRLMILALLAAGTVYISDSAPVQGAVRQALELCAVSVIPAIFPFLVLSSMLVACGFGRCGGRVMERLFRLPSCAASALLLGFAAGYPIGALSAAELYRQGELTKEEASRLLAFCSNANPVFLVTVLGREVFHSARTGLWLWLIHVSAALITGMLLRGSGKMPASRRRLPGKETASLPLLFVESVRTSAWNCLAICAFVTVFYVLSRPLAALGGTAGALLTGLTELFSLLPGLAPNGRGFVVAAVCTGFGGISVLCQTAAVLEGSGLSLRWYATGKLIQALLSAILAAATWQWI